MPGSRTSVRELSLHREFDSAPNKFERFYGRAAVCLTGQPRILDSHFALDAYFDTNGGTALGQDMFHKDWSWAGPRRRSSADNLVVTSMLNNLFAPISLYGGYDLFVISPGPVQGATQQGFSRDPTAGARTYEPLRPITVNSHGVADRMFLRMGAVETDIPFDRKDSRWHNYFYLSYQSKWSSGQSRIQSLLRQAILRVKPVTLTPAHNQSAPEGLLLVSTLDLAAQRHDLM